SKQISALIRTIQTDTADAVSAMERSTQGVVEGTKLSDEAGRALGEIGRVSTTLAELIDDFSNTTSRQAASAGTVAQSIQRILLVTEQTSEGTLQTAGSIRQLSELAHELKSSVTRFKVAGRVTAAMTHETRHDSTDTPDLATLSWCLGEIRGALSASEAKLREQLSHGDDGDDLSALSAARASLHQAHGALALVDLQGVSLLSAEAETLLDLVERAQLRLSRELVERVARSFAALTEYLDELLLGEPQQ